MYKFLLRYLLPRILQFFTVIFLGVTVTFIIPRLSPTDPVEAQVSLILSSGSAVDPEAIEHMREALTQMYGLAGSPFEQYIAFWGRLLRGDLGPSLSAFPTPVTHLIGLALPWTLGLMITAVIISWIIGNILGALASYYPKSKTIYAIDILSQAVRPIPYYVVALVLLVVFAYMIPIFPFSGAYPVGTRPSPTLGFALIFLRHSALTLILIGFGSWFIGMKSLTSNIISEDYVVYAEATGIKENKILSNYIMRNAMLPQITGLGLSLGTVFSGALIMEVVFQYPGMGMLTLQAVFNNDYSLIMGIAIYSIIGVATSVFIMDLIYPLFDPRVRFQ
ncbi:MAG: ABC transporter permease [Anaerolineaceae bacterium]|jgi:peptide/nickel transport system permease protein